MDKKNAKSKEIEKVIEETKEAEAPLPDISEITKKKSQIRVNPKMYYS